MDPTAVVVPMMLNLMVFATALYLRGQRQYLGHPPPALARMLTLCALFGVAHGLAQALGCHFTPREPVSLAWPMLDRDHFKCVHDALGHRAGDFVARLGGEEFLVGVTDPPGGRNRVVAAACSLEAQPSSCF